MARRRTGSAAGNEWIDDVTADKQVPAAALVTVLRLGGDGGRIGREEAMERWTGGCGYGRNWMLMTDRSGVKSIAAAIARHHLGDSARAACYLAARVTELLVNRFHRVTNRVPQHFREKTSFKIHCGYCDIFLRICRPWWKWGRLRLCSTCWLLWDFATRAQSEWPIVDFAEFAYDPQAVKMQRSNEFPIS